MKARMQTPPVLDGERIAEPVKKDLFVERRGKRLYRTNRRDLLIQVCTPISPENGKKKGAGRDLSALRSEISSYLFEYLRGFHIPTHFVSARPGAEMLVKYVDDLPLSVKVYNTPDEELTGRLGLPAAGEDPALEFPVIEHTLLRSDGTTTMVNEYHVYALNVATPEELKQINRISLKVNAVLRGLSDRRELALSDITLGFGRYNSQIVLTDELSPLTCTFVDVSGGTSAGKTSFKPGAPGSDSAIEGLCGRLKLNI
jgi:phosphoribosylaminoimidazole-succinocarboxamide synthase